MMRVVSLSDHPGAMRRDAQQRRAAADREAQQAHEAVLAVHRERVAQARMARDEAWAAATLGRVAARRLRRAPGAAAGPGRAPAGEPADG